MPLFRRREGVSCKVCHQRLTLLEWEDLRNLPKNPPYRCETCNQVFCLDCLLKGRVQSVGTGFYQVMLVCPQCGSAVIRYALKEPLPENPGETVRRRARELQSEHGPLVRVQCITDVDIRLIYKDGAVIDGRLQGGQLLLTCGYAGQGSTQFHAFLTESGFQISLEDVYDRHPPYTLRRE